MKNFKVTVTLKKPMLGTYPTDPETLRKFIIERRMKDPNYAGQNFPTEEEVAKQVGNIDNWKVMTTGEGVITDLEREKTLTIFPRDDEGNPIMLEHQIKGFFKEACGSLLYCKGEDIAKESCKMGKCYKKTISNIIFTAPYEIKINVNGEIGVITRSLRAQTQQGERIAIASSECIPAGSTFTFFVRCLADSVGSDDSKSKNGKADVEKAVKEWLDYGRYKGFLQWRNGGYGRFSYAIEEATADEFDEM